MNQTFLGNCNRCLGLSDSPKRGEKVSSANTKQKLCARDKKSVFTLGINLPSPAWLEGISQRHCKKCHLKIGMRKIIQKVYQA